ncbi:ComEC family competence protein [Tamlana haliotis]|uniref:ComEC family competence protein n=1 Tax=Pseudotamlana haliotis TaxID=2614804 RepID=A0A6N6MHK6_9FLAO|nr:ComEC/Rec2 family competence protein [Tamlana haliotis]KAB1068948.1 ComEC family competence protein [Tamlana haliotis]
MKLLNFTIIKLTVCLILGILVGYYAQPTPLFIIGVTGATLALVLIGLFLAKNQFRKTIWFGLSAFIAMTTIGVLSVQLHDQKLFSSHYTKQLTPEVNTLHNFSFRIKTILKPSHFHDKYIVDILEIDQVKTTGKVLLYIKKDSLTPPLSVDDTFLSRTSFKPINTPLNPYQFDYKQYLEKQYVYHQISVKPEALLNAPTHTQSIYGLADRIRKHINHNLETYHFQPNQLAIINALLLGQRQDISKELYSDYTNAGAIHILAVSGLHVGILLMILSFILKPIDALKHGKIIKTILLVSLLWAFAVIAGLSASVTRAVTMFSILAIALNLKRPTNIYNTLAISMFVLLLFKPLFIFDVGFQLSYIAVFSIVSIDPHLYKLWQPKHRILDLYWHTFTVTLAAQIGILPLSLYYFHQFPGLFFISNLVVIPVLSVVLAFGLIVLLLAFVNLLPHFLADFFGKIISLMNTFMNWIAQQEAFIFRDIPFTLFYVFLSYIIITSCFRFSIKKNYPALALALCAILLFQSTGLYNKYNPTSKEFIVFHKNRHSIIGHSKNQNIQLYHDLDSLDLAEDYMIRNYLIGSQATLTKQDSIKNVYQLDNKVLFLVDSLGFYGIKDFSPNYVLLRQSPRINLSRLIDSIKPNHIIADGSNYKSYINQWKAICKKRKLPFHHTGEKGAFIIKY